MPLANRMMMAASAGVTFLFRDDFTTDEAAPLTSPRTAEPGPGTGTIVDTNNSISITSSSILVNGATADLDGIVSGQFPRKQGRVFAFIVSDRTTVNGASRFGLSGAGLAGSGIDTGFDWGSPTTIRLKSGVGVIDTVSVSTNTQFATILFSNGGCLLYQSGVDWVILWIYNSPATAQYTKMWLGATSLNFKTDSWRISDLPTPWDTDNGIATAVLAGARSAGDTFTHEADCLIEAEIDTLPSSGQIEIWFRSPTVGTDGWRVTVDSTGALDLDEVVSGSPTQRGTAAGVVANSDRLMIIADDEEIKVYEANTLRITYSSAATNKTETGGELDSEGTGGAVSDIIAWPRTLSGAAKTALDAVANA